MHHARRSTLSQATTRCIGLEVHQESMAVASVAQEHGAEVTSLGTIDARQWDLDQRSRKLPPKATQVLFVSEAGPCGYGPDR